MINSGVDSRILYKDEQSMIIWKNGFTLESGIISLIHQLGVPPMLVDTYLNHILKLGGQIPQTIFKIMLKCSSLYRILGWGNIIYEFHFKIGEFSLFKEVCTRFEVKHISCNLV